MAHTRCRVVLHVLKINWERLLLTRVAHARSFNSAFLDRHCEGADELVASLETKQFVLPVGLVEENNVQLEPVDLLNCSQLSENVSLVFAFLRCDKLEKHGAETLHLLQRCAELDDDGNCFSKSTRTSMVENEESIQVTVRGLNNMTLHLLELCVEQSNFLDKVVVAESEVTAVTIDLDTVTYVVRVLDEYEDARLKEFLSSRGEEPRQSQ
jgi:hypothetical protein